MEETEQKNPAWFFMCHLDKVYYESKGLDIRKGQIIVLFIHLISKSIIYIAIDWQENYSTKMAKFLIFWNNTKVMSDFSWYKTNFIRGLKIIIS